MLPKYHLTHSTSLDLQGTQQSWESSASQLSPFPRPRKTNLPQLGYLLGRTECEVLSAIFQQMDSHTGSSLCISLFCCVTTSEDCLVYLRGFFKNKRQFKDVLVLQDTLWVNCLRNGFGTWSGIMPGSCQWACPWTAERITLWCSSVLCIWWGGWRALLMVMSHSMTFLCSYVLIPRNSNFIKMFLSLKLPINLSKLAND